jgi:hypothetical protein
MTNMKSTDDRRHILAISGEFFKVYNKAGEEKPPPDQSTDYETDEEPG